MLFLSYSGDDRCPRIFYHGIARSLCKMILDGNILIFNTHVLILMCIRKQTEYIKQSKGLKGMNLEDCCGWNPALPLPRCPWASYLTPLCVLVS